MSKVDYNQLDLLSIYFINNCDKELEPYAYHILIGLYLKSNGLNIKEINELFHYHNIKKVRKTLDKLSEEYALIYIDKSKCKGTEMRYFLTHSGKRVVIDHYTSS